jgi:hypothetical protein
MNDIWNTRYASKEYIYGSLPNEYFKQQIDKLTAGKLFLPAEGEGRNAVYAAKMGWKILAVDSSEVGKEKALKLASENKVEIQYDISDLVTYQYPINEYDVAGIVFAHFPSETRTLVYRAIADSLKKGGIIILETFSKKQLGKSSGGPQNPDMLNSAEELKSDFAGFEFIELYETQVELNEGLLHKGLAEVVRMLGVKK